MELHRGFPAEDKEKSLALSPVTSWSSSLVSYIPSAVFNYSYAFAMRRRLSQQQPIKSYGNAHLTTGTIASIDFHVDDGFGMVRSLVLKQCPICKTTGRALKERNFGERLYHDRLSPLSVVLLYGSSRSTCMLTH